MVNSNILLPVLVVQEFMSPLTPYVYIWRVNNQLAVTLIRTFGSDTGWLL